MVNVISVLNLVNVVQSNNKLFRKAQNNSHLSKLVHNKNIGNNDNNFVRQINRLTINVSDIMEAQSLTCTNSILKSFDLRYRY